MGDLAYGLIFSAIIIGFLICGIFATAPRPKILK
jgi:hypothetical protein